MKYILVNNEGTSQITAFMPDGKPLVADDTHKNFSKIVEAVLGNVDSSAIEDLFDVSVAIAKRFRRLSERVTARNGQIYLDGDPVGGGISAKINGFLDDEVGDWQPLVNFLEKVASNPEKHSREQLYVWLDRHHFTITADGNFLAYKGLRKAEDGSYTSVKQGPAIVDGEEVNGYVPNGIGSVIEMPRSQVQHNPASSCSTGLHVGTHAFAITFGDGYVVEVEINPRDVVSVPTHGDKVRVCRYLVRGVAKAARSEHVIDYSKVSYHD